jgi:Ca-activated chloride channel homolog
MKKDQVKLDILMERPIVRNDAMSEMDVVIEVNSEQSTDELDRKKALNLCLVIDRSGSMSGEKLETAKKSCIDIYKQLDEKDLFTVVVFDDQAEVVVNPQIPKSEVIEKINKIKTGGSTNLSLGWYLGLLELQTYKTENHNNRLFLLSDGQANQGETKVTILAQAASKSRELGMTTSTIGIGDDFQEDILAAIATESGGRFWYIQESQIKDIINEEFKGAMSVIIDRPRIELKLPAGVTVSKELNNLGKMADKYRTRPIKGEDQFNFAIRLEINPEKIETDNLNFEAILFDGEESITQTQMVVALKSSQEYVSSKINPVVQSVVQQFQITVTNEKIMGEMSQGGLDVIRKMLIEDVEGMRKVRDVLEKEREVSSPRDMQEIREISRFFGTSENALLLIEMLQDFEEVQEVNDFLKRWRRVRMQQGQRMNLRIDNEKNIAGINEIEKDLQVSLLEDAIELAYTLMQRFPDKKDHLLDYQRKIRENLARY